MSIIHKYIAYAIALLFALGINAIDANAKPASATGVHGLCATCDPIGDLIAAKTGWNVSALRPAAGKPVPVYNESWIHRTPEQNARAAEVAANEFRQAGRRRFDRAFAAR